MFLASLLKEYYGGKETNGVSLYDLFAWGSFEKDGANFFRYNLILYTDYKLLPVKKVFFFKKMKICGDTCNN